MSEKLGDLIDKKYEVRQKRIDIEREVKELKALEMELETQILSELADAGIEGAKGKFATAAIKQEQVPEAASWEDIYKFILETQDFTLLHKRLTSETWREYIANGVTVPGIVPFNRVSLSITKR